MRERGIQIETGDIHESIVSRHAVRVVKGKVKKREDRLNKINMTRQKWFW